MEPKIYNLSFNGPSCFIRRVPRGPWKPPTIGGVDFFFFFLPFMLVKWKGWGHRTLSP